MENVREKIIVAQEGVIETQKKIISHLEKEVERWKGIAAGYEEMLDNYLAKTGTIFNGDKKY